MIDPQMSLHIADSHGEICRIGGSVTDKAHENSS
jgi:hypothetical protein